MLEYDLRKEKRKLDIIVGMLGSRKSRFHGPKAYLLA
jgi:hypothetical protein